MGVCKAGFDCISIILILFVKFWAIVLFFHKYEHGKYYFSVPILQQQIQSTPDNWNLQGKSKKGLSYREFELPGVRRK